MHLGVSSSGDWTLDPCIRQFCVTWFFLQYRKSLSCWHIFFAASWYELVWATKTKLIPSYDFYWLTMFRKKPWSNPLKLISNMLRIPLLPSGTLQMHPPKTKRKAFKLTLQLKNQDPNQASSKNNIPFVNHVRFLFLGPQHIWKKQN